MPPEQNEAGGLIDGRALLDRLIERMRAGRIIIPGIGVIERLAATAMHSADLAAIAEIGALLSPPQCDQMDVLFSAEAHRQQSRLSWLRALAGGLGARSLAEMCATATRRALLRLQTWHMREDTYRAALASLTDAIHAEPLSAWFGEGWRASADRQA